MVQQATGDPRRVHHQAAFSGDCRQRAAHLGVIAHFDVVGLQHLAQMVIDLVLAYEQVGFVLTDQRK